MNDLLIALLVVGLCIPLAALLIIMVDLVIVLPLILEEHFRKKKSWPDAMWFYVPDPVIRFLFPTWQHRAGG